MTAAKARSRPDEAGVTTRSRHVGLRARLFVLLLLPMVAAMAGYGVVRLRNEERALVADERRQMARTAEGLRIIVERALRQGDTAEVQRLLDELVRAHEEIDRIRLLDVGLRTTLASPPLDLGDEIPTDDLRRALEGARPVFVLRQRDGKPVLHTVVRLRDSRGTPAGVLETTRLATGIEGKIRAGRVDLAQRIGLLTLLVGMLLWVGARWSVILPVRRLMRGVQSLTAGRPEPIAARGRDELAELARAFDAMAERLTAAQQQLVAESEARLDQARQLRQAEQLAVAGRIASEVAHEIGTPLNVISGRAEQLLRDQPPGDDRAAALRTILTQIDRIRGILASLLDVVRPRKPEVQLVTLRQPLTGIVELLRPTARARGLDLTTAIEPETRTLVDPNQLQQVVLNLLMNAIEASPPGGRVALEARPGSGGEGRPGVELRVIDSGSGIPPEQLARVFEPFFTTKPAGQGTGLGLAICRDIVREHGGTIDIESRVGAGTTVRVWLPAAPGHHA